MKVGAATLCGQPVNVVGSGHEAYDWALADHTFVVDAGRSSDAYLAYCEKLGNRPCSNCLAIIVKAGR